MTALVYFFVTLAALAVLFAFVHARITMLEREVRRLQRQHQPKGLEPIDYVAWSDDHE
jgi:hypothetical protein